jgi:hypothetical protein
VIEPIVQQAAGYEARTDGSALEVRRSNGVVVGEGRIHLMHGAFHVGDYIGEVDPQIHQAVYELLKQHEADIVMRWIAREREDEPS